ncbi:MAG: riboflavin synthase [Dehalococcoidia bacterium]|nr:MAG: riboflavin synthase [Dehalococcoidia bacterium]
MFTGIIEEVGTVKAAYPGKLAISAKSVLESTKKGDSIAINGACLTVVEMSPDSFSVDVMPETLRRTNLGALRPGDRVNLERPLAVGGRVGGHFVQGHVDGMGKVLSAMPENKALNVRYEAPPEIMRYVVEKGFIAVDGVSLTVVECNATSFKVSLVPYTLENTNLGGRRPGDVVNLEVDIIAKYVERLREAGSSITLEFLAEHGFLAR